MKLWKKWFCIVAALCCTMGGTSFAQEAKFIQIDGGFGLKNDGTVWKLPLWEDYRLGYYLYPEQFDRLNPSDTTSMIQLDEFSDAVKISVSLTLNGIPCNLAVLDKNGILINRKASAKASQRPESDVYRIEEVADVFTGDSLTMATQKDGSVWMWGFLHNNYSLGVSSIYGGSARDRIPQPQCVEGINNPRSMTYRYQPYESGAIVTDNGQYQAFESDRVYEDPHVALVKAADQDILKYFRFREVVFGNNLNLDNRIPNSYRLASRPVNRRIGILEDGRLFVDSRVVEEMGKVQQVDLGEVGDVVEQGIYRDNIYSAVFKEFYAPFAHYTAVKEDGTVWESGCLFPYLKMENGLFDAQTDVWYPIRGLENVVDIDVIGGDIIALKEDGTIIKWGLQPQIISTETPQSLQGRYCAFHLSTDSDRMVYNDDMYEIDPGRGTKPVMHNGRTYLPIRNLVEKAGGSVEWNAETETVTARLWDHEVQMQLGSDRVKVDGKQQKMDAVPFEENGRTMVPVRFLAEGFGFDVEWDETSQSVRLYYKELLQS